MASQALLDLGVEATRAKTVCAAITSSLADVLLTEASDANDAARIIGRDAMLLEECRRSLPFVNRLASGVGMDGVYVALQPLIILFGMPDYGAGREGKELAKGWVEIYGKALCKLCPESLAHAVDEWIRHGKPFMPKPSELYKLAEPVHLKANVAAWRMRKAVELADAGFKERKLTPEETEARRKLAQETLEALRGPGGLKGMPKYERPQGTPQEAAARYRSMAG